MNKWIDRANHSVYSQNSIDWRWVCVNGWNLIGLILFLQAYILAGALIIWLMDVIGGALDLLRSL